MDMIILCEDNYDLVIETVQDYAENQVHNIINNIEIKNIEKGTYI